MKDSQRQTEKEMNRKTEESGLRQDKRVIEKDKTNQSVSAKQCLD